MTRGPAGADFVAAKQLGDVSEEQAELRTAVRALLARHEGAGAWRPLVEQITTDQYPTAARRPMNSVLDCTKIRETFGISQSPWRTSLAAVIQELLDQKPGV